MCIGLGVVVGRSEDEWAHRKAGAGPQQEGEAGKRTGCHLTGVWNHHGETPLYPELQMENKYEKIWINMWSYCFTSPQSSWLGRNRGWWSHATGKPKLQGRRLYARIVVIMGLYTLCRGTRSFLRTSWPWLTGPLVFGLRTLGNPPSCGQIKCI